MLKPEIFPCPDTRIQSSPHHSVPVVLRTPLSAKAAARARDRRARPTDIVVAAEIFAANLSLSFSSFWDKVGNAFVGICTDTKVIELRYPAYG